jgi:ADP-ribosylglycohydrolase
MIGLMLNQMGLKKFCQSQIQLVIWAHYSSDFEESSNRVKAAFLGSICGCILGKPLEASLTGNEIKSALEAAEEWPMNDYVASKIKEYIPRVHESFNETAREYINYVAPDDDINYTIMGMLILEKFGLDFNHSDIEELWLHHLPIGTTFGPERTMLVKSGLESFNRWDLKSFLEKGGVGPRGQISEKESSKSFRILNDILNPGDELCGATIRADAYGYACPGNPEMAANLAWKDSSFTHNRTGIYGTMFVAAAIACAQIFTDRMKIFETALKYIPQRSRFHERVSACILDIKDF